MTKIRKSNGKSVRAKPKKAVISKPARRKVTQARAIAPSAGMEPAAASAVAQEGKARHVTTPFRFWTRMPFAIMDVWFSKFGRVDKRTGA